MHQYRILRICFALTSFVSAEDDVSGGTGISGTSAISDPIVEGTPVEPVASSVVPDFRVRSSAVSTRIVVEAPEMAGLPPVTGAIKVTVLRVDDPGLPDPPPPLPALPPEDPNVQARIAEIAGQHEDSRIAFVSATVYDHSRTFFRCYSSGEARNEIRGWSNVDFNHFSGFSSYEVSGNDGEVRHYELLIGLGNEDSKLTEGRPGGSDGDGEAIHIPNLPELAIGGPSFMLSAGQAVDEETIELIRGMHELYRAEGGQIAAAYQARIKVQEERRAYLLANPPKPEDLTIRFWKRKANSPVGGERTGGEP